MHFEDAAAARRIRTHSLYYIHTCTCIHTNIHIYINNIYIYINIHIYIYLYICYELCTISMLLFRS